MPDANLDRILTFAKQVGGAETDPYQTARRRSWLDDAGNVTKDGEALIEALDDQSDTRTVFRGNF